jgi:hypothetical protein
MSYSDSENPVREAANKMRRSRNSRKYSLSLAQDKREQEKLEPLMKKITLNPDLGILLKQSTVEKLRDIARTRDGNNSLHYDDVVLLLLKHFEKTSDK